MTQEGEVSVPPVVQFRLPIDVCLLVYISVCLFVYMFVCLFICLFVCLHVCFFYLFVVDLIFNQVRHLKLMSSNF